MKPARFDYHAPISLSEALDLVGKFGADARLLAGGQTLVPMLNFRLSRPAVIVDLNRVAELAYLRRDDGHLAIGAMTRQRSIESSEIIAQHAPLLREATRWIGHFPTRTRGTIGGSLAAADPAAEYPAVALALDFEMVLKSRRGERTVPASDFFLGIYTTAIEPDEILVQVNVPVAAADTGSAFEEIARRHGDFAMAGVAAQLAVADGSPTEVRLAACGVGPGPERLLESERIVMRYGLSPESLDRAAAAARETVSPSADVHSSSDYRRDLAAAMTRRALRRAADNAARGRP